MTILATTQRFFLREILASDAAGLWLLDSDPEVHRYLGNKPVYEHKQVEEVIQLIQKQYRENGIGRWAIIDKQNGEFVGWAGLKLITESINNQSNFYDIGYRILQRHWRKGIATETAKVVLHYGFETLNLRKISAYCTCDNNGSNQVLQKLGLRCTGMFIDENENCNWYEMSKADFESKYKNETE